MKKSFKFSVTFLLIFVMFFQIASLNFWSSAEEISKDINSNIEINEKNESELNEEIPDSDNGFLIDSKERNINLSNTANGVFIKANEYLPEFSNTENLNSDKIKENINKILDNVISMKLNTVFLETTLEKKTLFKNTFSEHLPELDLIDFDIIEYIISKSKEKNLYIIGLLDVLSFEKDGEIANPDFINIDVIDIVSKKASEIAIKYKFDGILLDNYYNCDDLSGLSYSAYMQSGSGIGYKNYMFEKSKSLIKAISYAIKISDFSIAIGLITDSVWANLSVNERGSETNVEFQMNENAFLNIFDIIEDKTVDFLTVKTSKSTENKNESFKTITNWWSNILENSDILLYFLHPNEKIGTTSDDDDGFKSPDQIVRQIIMAKQNKKYNGSVFSSYTKLNEKKDKSTDILIKYFNSEVKDDLILKDLYMTRPSKFNFNTYENTIMFTGTSDPNFELFINDNLIEIDKETGNFSIQFDLSLGLNKFNFKHKATNITYSITKKIKVLKSVSPNETVYGDGGMKVSISANAYSGSKVWAKIGGSIINLSVRENNEDEVSRESIYKDYYGYFTLPNATNKEQNLGAIVVSATYKGANKESMTGGKVIVNADFNNNSSSADESGTGSDTIVNPGSSMLRITAEEAETYPTTILDDDSVPRNYPYPKGAVDYINGNIVSYSWKGTVFTYYNLKSNRRVYVKDTELIYDDDAIKNAHENIVSKAIVQNNGKFTDIILKQAYKTPPIISLSDLSFTEDYSINYFSPGYLYIDLPYVKDSCELNFNDNQSFSEASIINNAKNGIYNKQIKLKFKNGKSFSGASSYYNNDGELVIRVRNPITFQASSNEFGYTLNDFKIVISAGHGGVDPGALGFNGINERELNLEIQENVVKYLKQIGAEVIVLKNNISGANISLAQRMINSRAQKPDMMISIHHNSASAVNASGVETYYFSPFTMPLARAINNNLANYYKNTMYGTGSDKYNRGDKFSWRYVTREMTFPAILVEYGFINNKEEFDRLIQTKNQDELAKQTVKGIIDYIKQMQ